MDKEEPKTYFYTCNLDVLDYDDLVFSGDDSSIKFPEYLNQLKKAFANKPNTPFDDIEYLEEETHPTQPLKKTSECTKKKRIFLPTIE